MRRLDKWRVGSDDWKRRVAQKRLIVVPEAVRAIR